MHKLPADAFTRADTGLTDKQIQHRLKIGVWTELVPGIFAHAATPHTPTLLRRAALLWAGPTAALSHRSAATMWTLDRVVEKVPELIVDRHLRSDDFRIHRKQNLIPTDITHRDGLRCTNPTRTIIDLASVLEPDALEAAFESARRQGLTTVAAVRQRQEQLGSQGRRGAHTLLALLNQLDGRAACESVLEVKVARLLRRSRLPAPVTQYDLRLFGHHYRLDFAWPELFVALECDGRAFHEFQRDRTRWRHLGASGWKVLPVTWHDVTQHWGDILNEWTVAIRGVR